jgi:transposase
VLYREHNRVERFFNKIKHCRRIAARSKSTPPTSS